MKGKREMRVQGTALSPGIAIGKPLRYTRPGQNSFVEGAISAGEVDLEIARYRLAIEKSREELQGFRRFSFREDPHDVGSLLEAHIAMTKDPLLTRGVEEKIRDAQKRAELAMTHVVTEYSNQFFAVENPYFQERGRDIVDITQRILRHLRAVPFRENGESLQGTILFVEELFPSDVLTLPALGVQGFVAKKGSFTSHAAMLARAKNIPYLAHVEIEALLEEPVQEVLLDGKAGILVIHPSEETKRIFLEKDKKQEKKGTASLQKAQTLDGCPLRVFANLDTFSFLDAPEMDFIEGVGLFRTEYLYLEKGSLPSQEEQTKIYQAMAEALGPKKPLILRLFDIGEDKQDLLAAWEKKISTPRSLRFLLRSPDLLYTQLRAIVQASSLGNIEILLPMVSDLWEVVEIRRILATIRKEISKEKGEKIPHIPLGCMVEVPSCALLSERFAQEVDFFSIGTNDLTCTTLGIEREYLSHYFSDCLFHPAVLYLLQKVIQTGRLHGKPVFVCGEMAKDPKAVPLLLGMGVTSFSVALASVEEVKKVLSSWSLAEAAVLAQGALQCQSGEELQRYLVKGERR